MAWTYGTKNTASYSQQTKNTADWRFEVGPGKTYLMGDFNMVSEFDESGSPVYLGQIGTTQTYTYQSKS